MSVRVSVATRSALVDMGEHLSPKYAPDKIAPPVSQSGTPKFSAIAAQMTPIVAAVPNAVPIKVEMSPQSQNVMSKIIAGEKKSAV